MGAEHGTIRVRTVVLSLLGLVALALALMAWAYGRTDTYLGRWFAWRASDVGDVDRFPARPIAAATEPRPLPSDLFSTEAVTIEYLAGRESRVATLGQLLADSGTSAFVALEDGRLVLEWYGEGHSRDSVVTSFSIAKSVTALLVLAAIEDGSVGGLEDRVTTYLPELRGLDPGYERITLSHLLNMRSGIRFRDHDLPWGDKARVYYEPRLRELVTSLPIVEPPGERFAYNSYNPVLLGLVLERATGREPAAYLQRRLWARIGAEYSASWSTSREGETLPKMESGLNARAIDFAKLGQTLLSISHGAEYAPIQNVLAPATVEPLLRVNAASAVPEQGEGIHYQLGWWIYEAAPGRSHAIAALGHLGQYLFVYPEERVVIARFGERQGAVDSWRTVFDQVAAAVTMTTVTP